MNRDRQGAGTDIAAREIARIGDVRDHQRSCVSVGASECIYQCRGKRLTRRKRNRNSDELRHRKVYTTVGVM